MNEHPIPASVNNGMMVKKEVSTSFSGPLPHPDILQKYNAVVPGAAERIIIMAEKQSSHRQMLEVQVIGSDIKNSRTGLLYGFIISILGLVIAAIAVLLGSQIFGTVLGGGVLASLAGTFIYGSSMRRKERAGRRKEAEE